MGVEMGIMLKFSKAGLRLKAENLIADKDRKDAERQKLIKKLKEIAERKNDLAVPVCGLRRAEEKTPETQTAATAATQIGRAHV